MSPAVRRSRVARILREVFGLSELRQGQQAVIDGVLLGQHTLAIMPTGAGKSLCYQLPALLMPGMTLVVSPLIALMRDQFDKLSALGLDAVQINSAIPADELRRGRTRVGRRAVEFVFTTPEQLANEDVSQLLAGGVVDLLVIDEAHCISQWGHDFRPAYLDAVSKVHTLGSPTVLALTATATPDVVTDIERHLGVGPLRVINTGAYRPNLSYHVRPVANDADKDRQLIDVLRSASGSLIVYAATVRHVDRVMTLLRTEGIEAVSYHGRQRASAREEAQTAFMTGVAPVIVATNAFGMGIDKPDIRRVVHYDLPPSLDVYYQESGRAGRDGDPADCILLFQRSDRGLQRFFMAGRYPTADDFTALVTALRTVADAGSLTVEEIQTLAPDIPATRLRVMLTVLKHARLLSEHRRSRYQVRTQLASAAVDALAAAYDERRSRDQSKLEQMIIYAQTALCRTRVLLEALGETLESPGCGACDNCRGVALRAEAAAAGASALR